ncbi:MAG: hypothetical protein IPK82_43870 [Polyangiaceae bacterium]|nr:hypothetical protein [Polyangiaceae bacterium]
MTFRSISWQSLLAALAVTSFVASACTDEGEPTGGTSTSTGGATTTSATGAGGSGGSGGSGGGNSGGGGAAVSCLGDSVYTSLFTIEAADLCAVAVYTSSGAVNYQQPTWGSHGGPLLVAAGANTGEVTLSRWSAPSGSQGAMTVADTTVNAKIPKDTFVAGVAVDLGVRPGTLVSYQGAFPDTQGEVIVVDGMNSDERYDVNGLFSMAFAPSGQSGRLLFSGLSPLGEQNAAPNGLYAADDCMGTFDPSVEPTCADSTKVATWGDASGPVVLDTEGNLFTVMTNFSGDQEGRVFAASSISKGAAPTDGTALFTLPGFGQALAAIGPEGTQAGIVAFQPADGTTFEALDVLQVRYTSTGGTIAVNGEPAPLLKLATPATPLALLADPDNRLWVGVPTETGTTFVVLARKPM